jgi:hypothetical protein
MSTVAYLAPYLAVAFSVAATQVLLIFSECHDTCRGYMGRAIYRMWPFLITALVIQSVLGLCLYELALKTILGSGHALQRVAGAGAIGFAAVVVPNGIIARGVTRFLARPAADLAKDLDRPLSRIVLAIWVLRHFKATAQWLKSLENFSYQFQQNGWDFAFSADKKEAERIAARRLRILFELQKAEIADKRRQPEFLNLDVNFFPGNRFFLLVAHLGRRRLRALLRAGLQTTPPRQDWDGRERRMLKGRKQDRRQPDLNAAYARVGDDPVTLELIKEGRLF